MYSCLDTFVYATPEARSKVASNWYRLLLNVYPVAGDVLNEVALCLYDFIKFGVFSPKDATQCFNSFRTASPSPALDIFQKINYYHDEWGVPYPVPSSKSNSQFFVLCQKNQSTTKSPLAELDFSF